MGYLIEWIPDSSAGYYSAKLARDLGAPTAWVKNPEDATHFESRAAAEEHADQKLPHQAPHCRVVLK